MKTKWIATAVLVASSAGLLGSAWHSAQAEGLNGDVPNGDVPNANRPDNGQERPRPRGMRGGPNGGPGGRWGMPRRDAASEVNRIAMEMERDFDTTLTDAQKAQLKTAIEAREAAVKLARDNFQSRMSQITGVTPEQLRAKRREMRRGPGGPGGPNGFGGPQGEGDRGPNGRRNENGGPQGPPPMRDDEMMGEPLDELMEEVAPR